MAAGRVSVGKHLPEVAFGGAVLTGGASRRMGTDKATMVVDGLSMAERSVAALNTAGAGSVVCVGGRLDELRRLGLSAIDEPHAGDGPISGILGALDAATEPCTVIIPCDLLEPDPAALAALAANLDAQPDFDVAFARVEGVPQWVVGAWRPTARSAIGDAFTGGVRAIRHALDGLQVCYVDSPASLANDADRPIDLPKG